MASNYNNGKLSLWGIFKLQAACLVAWKTNSKNVIQKNQNIYYKNNIGICILIPIFLFFFIIKTDYCCGHCNLCTLLCNESFWNTGLTSISETFVLTLLSHLGYWVFVATRHATQNQTWVLGQIFIIGVKTKVWSGNQTRTNLYHSIFAHSQHHWFPQRKALEEKSS